MIRVLCAVLVALVLFAGVVVGIRRRTLCPLSVGAGLASGLAVAVIVVLA